MLFWRGTTNNKNNLYFSSWIWFWEQKQPTCVVFKTWRAGWGIHLLVPTCQIQPQNWCVNSMTWWCVKKMGKVYSVRKPSLGNFGKHLQFVYLQKAGQPFFVCWKQILSETMLLSRWIVFAFKCPFVFMASFLLNVSVEQPLHFLLSQTCCINNCDEIFELCTFWHFWLISTMPFSVRLWWWQSIKTTQVVGSCLRNTCAAGHV